jgi:Nif-specific regulatory protein
MKEKLGLVAEIAATETPVWIFGEAGTGKALVAEQIHLHGKQSAGEFKKINCARKDLLPFDFPRFGTVFFDEIALLSRALQEEILKITRQESFISGEAGVRFVASTRHDVEKMVENGAFSKELYYKLNILPVFIPPLRDRKEDVMPMAKFFLGRFAEDIKKNIEGFTDEAQDFLLEQNWPGNARELKNVIERACIVSASILIYKNELCIYNDEGLQRVGEGRPDLKSAVDNFKAFFIEKTLEEARGNQTGAAKNLGIQRTYLSKLIKDLNINNKRY